jgi:hypothetical protein
MMRRALAFRIDPLESAVEHAVRDWATVTETIPMAFRSEISRALRLAPSSPSGRRRSCRSQRNTLGSV